MRVDLNKVNNGVWKVTWGGLGVAFTAAFTSAAILIVTMILFLISPNLGKIGWYSSAACFGVAVGGAYVSITGLGISIAIGKVLERQAVLTRKKPIMMRGG